MEIRWTPEAASSLEHISLQIAEDDPEAALKTVRIIFQRIEQLVTFSHRGRMGRQEGSRELVAFSSTGCLAEIAPNSAQFVGQPILAAAGFQPAPAGHEDSWVARRAGF